MWLDATGFLWISDGGEIAGLLIVVLGLFLAAHLAIARQSSADTTSQRLGECLVRSEMLTDCQVHIKPLRFSSSLRFDATGQYAGVEKVAHRGHLASTLLYTSSDSFGHSRSGKTDKSRLHNRRRDLAA